MEEDFLVTWGGVQLELSRKLLSDPGFRRKATPDEIRSIEQAINETRKAYMRALMRPPTPIVPTLMQNYQPTRGGVIVGANPLSAAIALLAAIAAAIPIAANAPKPTFREREIPFNAMDSLNYHHSYRVREFFSKAKQLSERIQQVANRVQRPLEAAAAQKTLASQAAATAAAATAATAASIAALEQALQLPNGRFPPDLEGTVKYLQDGIRRITSRRPAPPNCEHAHKEFLAELEKAKSRVTASYRGATIRRGVVISQMPNAAKVQDTARTNLIQAAARFVLCWSGKGPPQGPPGPGSWTIVRP